MRTKFDKLLPSEYDPTVVGRSRWVTVDQVLRAVVVIVGVGVAPATEYLWASGFNLERDGGIAVDE